VLSVDNIRSAYGRIEVLHGVTLQVDAGEIVTLIGANGAGKTTLMHAISGVQPITGGAIRFEGRSIERLPAHLRVAAGISQVPEGRQVFDPLSVSDNLRLGAWSRRSTDLKLDLARIYALFPMLEAFWEMPAGTLSGGQQQMLAIGRALMARPRLLLLDEPSMGLAPKLVAEIYEIVGRLNREERVAVLLAEQNATMALQVAQHGYVMENGRIVLDGDARTISQNEDIKEFYLGLTGVGQRKSYRDVKHYRRRKRWLS